MSKPTANASTHAFTADADALVRPLTLPSARIVLGGVSKRWVRDKPPILDGIDLTINRGKLISLVGRNGVGKTTLLRIIAGLIHPDAGHVEIDGLRSTKDRRAYQRRVGFLSAGSGGLYARLTVRRHLDFWARLALIPATERGAKIEQAIDRFELGEYAGRRTDRISMGERQRLRLAMAFVHEPTVALLDEPWNSLDEDGKRLLEEILDEFTADGGTAICCSPNPDDQIARKSDVYLVRDGAVERS